MKIKKGIVKTVDNSKIILEEHGRKVVVQRKVVRKITAEKKERINRLAEILYHYLPLHSRSSNAITFKSIFRESSIAAYLEGPDNKRQALQKGFEKLYRYHEKLPRMVIRKIVPAAIEYWKHQRNPLVQEELDALSRCLSSLDIDMSDELSKIVIDEQLPRITVPPEKLKENLRQHDLEPAIASEPLQLFNNGHFNEAVRKAFERFEDKVRELSAIEASGRELMGKAFSTADYLDISRVENENKQSFVDGYKLLAMGSMAAIRNIFSHGDEERRSPEECFEMLLFLNWLFRYLYSGS